MRPIVRIFGIGAVFAATSLAWVILGSVMDARTRGQTSSLSGQVTELWGSPQSQQAPRLFFEWTDEVEQSRTEIVDGQVREIREKVQQPQRQQMLPGSTDIVVDLDLDQRLKGLVWYALYDVSFRGTWTYTHTEPRDGRLRIDFSFPDAGGLYDDFRFVVNGRNLATDMRPEGGMVSTDIPITQGDRVTIEIGYASRGLGEWRYVPAPGVANLERFSLVMRTDFDRIDFPEQSMSPSSRSREGSGWTLAWRFSQIVTGHGIGMVMPVPIQPGELASRLSYSAPISLLFFFLVLFVLASMRRIDIHPINYLFLGGAFFAFHLLFGYAVDHINVALAFGLSSLVSVILVVSYLRLVVSRRFAFVEAGAAQIVYLIGFSVAHFWDGFTGLTVTVLSILTLFLLMQMTGRINWTELLRRQPAEPRAEPPYTEPVAGTCSPPPRP